MAANQAPIDRDDRSAAKKEMFFESFTGSGLRIRQCFPSLQGQCACLAEGLRKNVA